MTNHFDDPKHLVSHARDEIQDADSRIRAFFDRKPYARIVEIDDDGLQEIHKIRLTARIPPKISLIIKDAAGSLRDALDHAVYASAVTLLGGVPKDTGFPFAKNAAGVVGELGSKRLAGNPPEIRSFLESLRPYEGGNDLLWGLNQIRNPNTHRFIVPVGTASIGHKFRFSGTVVGNSQLGYSKWDSAKNEAEFLRIGRGSSIKYEVSISFDVLFEEGSPLSGKPAVSTLREVSSEVERVVNGIEAETARILGP